MSVQFLSVHEIVLKIALFFYYFQDDVFEEAVEAFEVFKDDLADNKAVEVFKDGVIVDNDSGPVSLEKFDDLKEVRIYFN